jgi:hypothetical protein
MNRPDHLYRIMNSTKASGIYRPDMTMPARLLQWTLLFVVAALIGGCKEKELPPPEPLDPSALVSTLKEHFASASPEVRDAVDKMADHFAKKEYVTAFQVLDQVSRSPDLKEESRIMISRAHLTLNDLIAKAAQEGDRNSKKLMENIQKYK